MLAAVMTCGCARVAPERLDRNEPGVEEPKVQREVQTERVSATQKDDAGKIVWEVKARSANLDYRGDGQTMGEMSGVTGTIHDEGKPVSAFEAEQGSADQATKVLSLEGRVKVRSIARGETLEADRVVWRAGKRLLEADGNVSVDGDGYRLGPFPRILAAPDLGTIGTPDRFETGSGTLKQK